MAGAKTALANQSRRHFLAKTGAAVAVGLAAGTAALLLDERPDLDPARLREILEDASGNDGRGPISATDAIAAIAPSRSRCLRAV